MSRVPRRISITVRLEVDLAQRLKTFVRDNAGRPLYANLTGFLSAAIEAHLARTEALLERDDVPNRNHDPVSR